MTKKTIRQSPSGVPVEVLTPSTSNPPNPAKYLSETGEYTVPASGGSQTLATTLGFGNTTSGNPIVISPNDYITSEENLTLYSPLGFSCSCEDGGMYLTTRGPDELVLSAGGLGAGNQALLKLRTADRGADQNSGHMDLRTGQVSAGISGDMLIETGHANDGGASGIVQIQTGGVSGGNSGDIDISSGNVTTSGSSGDIAIKTGTAPNGHGDIDINSGDGELTLSGSAISLSVAGTLYQLPPVDGSPGQVLSTDGNGILSWITP